MEHDKTTKRFNGAARPTVQVDVGLYQSYLDNTNMSQAQKEEFLQAMWSIILGFVDLGWEVHPVQEACGQNDETNDPPPESKPERLYSENSKIAETFNNAPEVE
ncbi:hypothetical protein [Martelella radicis]|uniref:Uncharacterized protein n=1 Tax=Martelella radicis TaxID=1397476 RepID=A0A7W6PC27_9HYPH|nr:hypothetical protein [Martelella radicis]MBB4124091.1 hypothetical protein [Martelella radicis]